MGSVQHEQHLHTRDKTGVRIGYAICYYLLLELNNRGHKDIVPRRDRGHLLRVTGVVTGVE